MHSKLYLNEVRLVRIQNERLGERNKFCKDEVENQLNADYRRLKGHSCMPITMFPLCMHIQSQIALCSVRDLNAMILIND